MTFEQHGSRSGSFVPFIADMLHRVRIVWLFWYNKQELEGINNQPPRVKLFSFGKLTLLITLYRFKYVTTTYLLFVLS